MLAFIKGKIIHKESSYIIIDTGNLGYEIKISLNTYSEVKDLDECSLFTYLQIREDNHTLYGFMSMDEKKCFLSLTSVKGVGPSVALSILSTYKISEIINAIVINDISMIKSVKGVGPKMAQRIILELKDKISKLVSTQPCIQSNSINRKVREEALAALTTLGINKNTAEKSINSILIRNEEEISVEDLIKEVLNNS